LQRPAPPAWGATFWRPAPPAPRRPCQPWARRPGPAIWASLFNTARATSDRAELCVTVQRGPGRAFRGPSPGGPQRTRPGVGGGAGGVAPPRSVRARRVTGNSGSEYLRQGFLGSGIMIQMFAFFQSASRTARAALARPHGPAVQASLSADDGEPPTVSRPIRLALPLAVAGTQGLSSERGPTARAHYTTCNISERLIGKEDRGIQALRAETRCGRSRRSCATRGTADRHLEKESRACYDAVT
jgi:hypothetical protein